jgi:hypothetical protein
MKSQIDYLADFILEAFAYEGEHPESPIKPMERVSHNTDPELQKQSDSVVSKWLPDYDPKTLFFHGTDSKNAKLPYIADATSGPGGAPNTAFKSIHDYAGPGFHNLIHVAGMNASKEGRIFVGQVFTDKEAVTFGDPENNPQESYNSFGASIHSKSTGSSEIAPTRGGMAVSKELTKTPDNEEKQGTINKHQTNINSARRFTKIMADKGYGVGIHAYPKVGAGTVIRPFRKKYMRIVGEIPSSEIPRLG